MKSGRKVAVGMSGGVDSSVSAHLLVEQGFDVTGVYLECWRAPGCRTQEDRADALKIALSLGIPFKVLDFKDAYKNSVVSYFFDEYQRGRTPNPDILCNTEIKFGLFYLWAIDAGFDAVATGHYAKIMPHPNELSQAEAHLSIPKDTHKDQTYFLHRLRQDQLGHIIFPLSDLTKNEVRDLARDLQLHVSEKKDSVGICFIGDINVKEFLKEHLGKNPGEVILPDGTVVGSHQGLWFYTIGQRSGFQLNQTRLVETQDGPVTKHNIPPFYVIAKKPDTNQLVVAFGAATQSQQFEVDRVHWIQESPPNQSQLDQLKVRIRHTGALLSCTFDAKQQQVTLKTPVQGIATGQSAVFYSQNHCLGGGIIEAVEYPALKVE